MSLFFSFVVALAPWNHLAEPGGDRPRVVILTDISSLKAGEAEPDDGQSMIRLMLYSNEFDIEGLVATSNLGHGQRVRPDLIGQVVDAYALDRENLLRHDPRYPQAEALRAVIKAGQPIAGPKVRVEDSVGEGKNTEGSDWIIRVVDRTDPRPVWVLIWGGSADLAQALWKVRAERSAAELKAFLSRLRVHSIGDQDSTGPWIREQFPSLRMITQRRAYRGMYRGGDASLVRSDWVRRHIRGHGHLGDLYPDYRGGDIWSSSLGPVRGIKEGDTPSFLFLVPNGLAVPDRVDLGSWGGRFAGQGPHIEDIADTDLDTSGDPDPRMSSVYRWRAAFQADFQARLDWCHLPFNQANHPPRVVLQGDRIRRVETSSAIELDAARSSDPDGHGLLFQWSVYPADPELVAGTKIEPQEPGRARVEIEKGLEGRQVAVLLSVSDQGEPPLTRYAHLLLKVNPRP